ncbi:uncharacterized protein LOC108110017 [Drosophila eugracilis]|uniref:uncharacterized protein LOC108110017 n=1 Tax=Drosophila eugracilis TaxID=29029 RepID=UPI0007E75358|nr:uncharacterized protein LOC108110017 [Drosophila eugracilis]XP_017074345.1 uncharacterized protein LOC108110017 [Drosophila eugracilis]
MLKWAVNQPRPSYLARDELMAASEVVGSSYSEFHALRGKLKRKSLGVAQGKENQLTSTPLPASSLTLNTRTPLLKDLSNILATPPSGGARGVPAGAAATQKFACTLPTFEAEYSPNATVIPGSMIALRGVGIPDSYFEKPRYLEQKPLPHPHPAPPAAEQNTLSSSQMGDVTLERMIDAILESNRKVLPNPRQHLRQPRQHLRQRHRQQVLRNSHTHTQTPSPTYRPAFDPASDLCEYWKSPSRRDSLPANGFEEREVRSPVPLTSNAIPSQGKRHSLQLRRQRVVRRKRKITTKISSSVRQSAQKLLAAARSGTAAASAQKIRHISPDSGHNSTSDCELEEEHCQLNQGFGGEDLEDACQLDAMWLQVQARDATKRRLSFSLVENS